MKKAQINWGEMNFKKKVGYIWDYYKLHIIGVVFLVAVASTFIYENVTKEIPVFNITFTVDGLTEEGGVKLEEEVNKLVADIDKPRESTDIGYIPVSTTASVDPMMRMQYMQKLSLDVMAGEIDLMVIDKDDLDNFVSQGLLLNLNDISGLNINEKLYCTSTIDGVNYGISLEESDFLQNLNFKTENKVLVVCGSTKRLGNIPRVVEMILK